ncbi:bifunctional UDP-N-acetylglucosamine diphosphorylase/glucosamine-1-phosphate N-acetyltransferase GlmU [Candidatus Blochmanniella vafra]|uniref:bifunctional UDP-N-acetylglucosamine diphosphorylase/glucosamine-1-phosphate N-acetyltransferase GlmU n=1 Tax=Candidatus Blochmanniella vafra TaxID=251535 RepID=UPI003B21C252
MWNKNFNVIILAAGYGERMLSDIPKVMHKIAGKSMLQHLIDSVCELDIQLSIYVVYSCKKDMFVNSICINDKNISISWVFQGIPKGTGHAVQKVLPMLYEDSEILVLYGDVPLISSRTLKKLLSVKLESDIALLTANVNDPTGYGRIIRNEFGQVIDIKEDSDIVNDNHRKITEINSGIFISVSKYIKNWVGIVQNNNVKNELYLTDIFKIAYQNKYRINTINPIDEFEIIGINSKLDLIKVERIYQKNQAYNFVKSGVVILDPYRFDLRGTLVCGKDVYIDVNVIIEGCVSLGNRVKIGAGCILKNVEIGDDVIICPFSFIENSKISFASKIGPFSRLRPNTQLGEKTYIGNFVELKNVQLGKKSKVGHLSYLGDAQIGNQVNIGAGTIICNYDGIKKHQTYIEDDVFIGSDSQLIAPIRIGKSAIIGAGTTVTKNVEEGKTVISRIQQFSISNKKYTDKK